MTDVKTRFIKKKLILSDPEKSYILKTNASDYTMKDILKQKINRKFHPVISIFGSSRTLNLITKYIIRNC